MLVTKLNPILQDPDGVKALLETLRKSQAYAQAIKSSEEGTPPSTLPLQGVQPFDSDSFQIPAPGPRNPSINPSTTNLSHAAPSVADLLSQLQAIQVPTPGSNSAQGGLIPDPPPASLDYSGSSSTSNSSSDHNPPAKPDVRTLSFQQSLAHIARLGEDPNFIAELVKVIICIRYYAATSYTLL